MNNKIHLHIFFALVFFFFSVQNGSAYQLILSAKLDKEPVWIGGPIEVGCTIHNTSRKKQKIFPHEKNQQAQFFLRDVHKSTWNQIFPDWLDEHADYFYLSRKDTYSFNPSLNLRMLLEPSKSHVIRVLYLKVDPSQFRKEINIDEPDKRKMFFTDLYFETPGLNSRDQAAYNWILEKKIAKAFGDLSFFSHCTEEESQTLKQFVQIFPDLPFTEWAIAPILINIMRSVSQSEPVSDDDIKLAIDYGETLLNSEVRFFRDFAAQDLRTLKRLQKKQKE